MSAIARERALINHTLGARFSSCGEHFDVRVVRWMVTRFALVSLMMELANGEIIPMMLGVATEQRLARIRLLERACTHK